MDTISLEDYLNNSGTTGSQKLYRTASATCKKVIYRKLKNGLYERIEERPMKVITVPR